MWIWLEFALFDCAPNCWRRPRRKGHVPRLFMVVPTRARIFVHCLLSCLLQEQWICVQRKERILYTIRSRVVRMFYIKFIFISYIASLLLFVAFLSVLVTIRPHHHPHPLYHGYLCDPDRPRHIQTIDD